MLGSLALVALVIILLGLGIGINAIASSTTLYDSVKIENLVSHLQVDVYVFSLKN